MAFYNTGLQANLAYDPAKDPEFWQTALMVKLGIGFDNSVYLILFMVHFS